MLEKDKPIFSPVGDLVLCFGGTRVFYLDLNVFML
jgi:hypothetical protein